MKLPVGSNQNRLSIARFTSAPSLLPTLVFSMLPFLQTGDDEGEATQLSAHFFKPRNCELKFGKRNRLFG